VEVRAELGLGYHILNQIQMAPGNNSLALGTFMSSHTTAEMMTMHITV